MGDFERKEAEKRDAERSKNDLEAYIISTGGILEEGTYDEVLCTNSHSLSCCSAGPLPPSTMHQNVVAGLGRVCHEELGS